MTRVPHPVVAGVATVVATAVITDRANSVRLTSRCVFGSFLVIAAGCR